MNAFDESRKRWVVGHFLGPGDLIFETCDPIAPGIAIQASKLTRIGQDGEGKMTVEKMSGYRFGVLSDPVTLTTDTMVYSCALPENIVEHVESLWSRIIRPGPKGLV